MGGRISFLPIQDGTGTPSPENVRPIRAPLYIDGIGEIYGGYVDIEAGTVVEEWYGFVMDGIQYYPKLVSRINDAGYAISYDVPGSRGGWPNLPYGRYHTTLFLANTLKVLVSGWNLLNENCLQIGRSGEYLYIRLAVNPEELDDVSSSANITASLATWLQDHSVQVVYLLFTPIVHSLTPAQLKSALDQLHYVPEPIIESRHRILMNTPHLVTPASSSLVMFNADMVAPLKECRVHFAPVQEGTGDPSPENVRPITGWTGVEVTRCGKNLIPYDDPAYPSANYDFNSTKRVIYDAEEQAFILGQTGVGIAYSSHAGPKTRKLFIAPTNLTVTITLEYKNIGTDYGIRLNTNEKRITDIHGTADNEWHTFSRTIDLDKDGYIYLAIYSHIYWRNIQLEVGSTATDYEPYSGTTFSIDWSNSVGTVGGGYVDLVNGEVVITSEKKILDGSEDWKLNAWSHNGVYIINYETNFDNRKIPYRPGTADEMYCNMLKSVNSTYFMNTDKTFCVVGADTIPNFAYLLLYNSEWGETVEEYKAVLKNLYDNGTPVEIVAPLKTVYQQRYTIDPITLKTLRGLNNIWSNANGNIDLSYFTHK